MGVKIAVLFKISLPDFKEQLFLHNNEYIAEAPDYCGKKTGHATAIYGGMLIFALFLEAYGVHVVTKHFLYVLQDSSGRKLSEGFFV